jgi:hypothetical protein
MVYHPQTDGLTEWKNQWLKQFLCLITANQDKWSIMLPLATLVHNNAQNTTMGLTSNQLLSRLEPVVTPNQSIETDNLMAELQVEQLRQWLILATKVINIAANSRKPIVDMF